MIQISDMRGFAIEYRTGDRIGKLGDLAVDTTKELWPVVGLIVDMGFGKGDKMIDPGEHIEVDIEEERNIELGGKAILRDPHTDASRLDHMRLHFLDGKKVFSSDEQLVGKVYDAVVFTHIKPWNVKKLLVSTKGLKSRRIRLDVNDITKVTTDGIVLDMEMAEIEETEEQADIDL